jgi:uncharacterized membrane protein
MESARLAVLVAGILHLGFVAGEMFPWSLPVILKRVITQRQVTLSTEQATLVATIVRNAGIYNLIVAAGFFWSAFPDALGLTLEPLAIKAIRCFFLAGAIVAGVFGLTLSPWTALQAVAGAVGLVLVLS